MKRYLSWINLAGAALFLVGGLVFYLGSRLPRERLENPPQIVVGAEKAPERVRVALYFAKPDGSGFVLERREVALSPGEDRINRALAELAKGPTRDGAPVIPPGEPPPRAFETESVIYIDLPGRYRQLGFGVRGETLLLYGLANTALANSNAQEVRFLVDGQPQVALKHLSLADPIRRAR